MIEIPQKFKGSELTSAEFNALVADVNAKLYASEADTKYVAKIAGKGLSTEDFTSELKAKLSANTSYSDAQINAAIAVVQNQLNTLVGTSASTAIDTFREIESFLATITDSQTLVGLLNSLKVEILAAVYSKTESDTKYVAKIVGKGLSTEDFTSELKAKLSANTNYSDAQINAAIAVVQNQLNTLVGTSASTAIDTFREIESFLATITDSQTLVGLLNSLKTEILAAVYSKTEADTKYVAKIAGKGLSTEDFDTALKTKLTNLPSEVYSSSDVDNMLSDIQVFVAEMSAMDKNIVGYYRDKSASSPTLNFIYTSNIEGVYSIFKMGLFDRAKGTRTHTFAGASLAKDVNGNAVLIDGTDGDVLNYTSVTLYAILGRLVGANKVWLLSDSEFTYGGIKAKAYSPFAIAPQFTVVVSGIARSVYNLAYNGTADTSAGFTGNYRSAAGFPTNSVSQFSAQQYARAQNANTARNFPFMSPMSWMNDIIDALSTAECQTMDKSDASVFGAGITPTFVPTAATFDVDSMPGITGVKVVSSALVDKGYYAFNATALQVAGIDKTFYTMLGSGNNVYTEMLEAQRVLAYAYDNNIAAGVKFQMAGTASNIHYKYRSVPNCAGLSVGVMTGVVFKYIEMTAAAGTTWKTTNATYSITAGDSAEGCIVTYQLSMPVWRGFHLYGDRFVQYVGRAVVCHNETTNPLFATLGTNYKSLFATDNWQDVPVYADSALASVRTDASLFTEEKNYTHIADISSTENWVKESADGVPSFPKTLGATRNTYECFYSWLSGTATAGAKENRASAFGCNWTSGNPSVRSVYSINSVSSTLSYYVGSLAVPDLDLAKQEASA